MAGRIVLDGFNPALDSNGQIDDGATITFYANGTTEFQTIYAEADLQTPLDNPLSCNAAGRFPEVNGSGAVWAPDGTSYSIKMEFTNGDVLTRDDIRPEIVNPSAVYYDMYRWKAAVPSNSEILIKANIPRPLTLAQDLNDGSFPSIFTIDTNPTATLVLTLAKNGGPIGTVSFSTSGVATVSFANDASFVAGDQFSVTNQATADATGAGIALTFVFRAA
jgi:hypothetical protein